MSLLLAKVVGVVDLHTEGLMLSASQPHSGQRTHARTHIDTHTITITTTPHHWLRIWPYRLKLIALFLFKKMPDCLYNGFLCWSCVSFMFSTDVCPGVTLCDWQDGQMQLLPNSCGTSYVLLTTRLQVVQEATESKRFGGLVSRSSCWIFTSCQPPKVPSGRMSVKDNYCSVF